MSKFIDLTGQKFGRLTVIGKAEKNKNGSTQWLCECSCKDKNIVVVTTGNLRQGTTKSCGCLKRETGIKNKKYNKYDLSGDYGVGYTRKNEEFYFDLEDYNKIKDYCWRIRSDGYVVSSAWNGNTCDIILMHRIIMNVNNKNLTVDHIHGLDTRNDNRKANLRIATYSQNGMNKTTRKDNTSGIVGVSWSKNKNKWVSYITKNKKRIVTGYYCSLDDAINSRKIAEEKYFGEWSYDKSINL